MTSIQPISSSSKVYHQKRTGGMTDLHKGIKEGDEELVGKMLAGGANPLVLTDGKESCLHLCLNSGNIEMALFLLDKLKWEKAKLEKLVNLKNGSDHAPLYLASKMGLIPLVNALIEAGASIDEMNGTNGETALHAAAEAGHAEIVYMLCRIANVNQKNLDGFTPLFLAIRNRRRDVVSALLLFTYPNILLENGPDGSTALHEAAKLGEASVLRHLCITVRDLDGKNRKGYTPLFEALLAGQIETAKLLLDAGADVNLENGVDQDTVLHLAAIKGSNPITELLVNRSGIEIDKRNKHLYTPLGAAVSRGCVDSAQILAAAGADVHTRCGKDKVPLLHLAAGLGHSKVIAWLCTVAGVDVNQKVKTPLSLFHPLGSPKNIEQVKAEFKAVGIIYDPTQTDLTPLFAAASGGHVEAAEELLRAGAKVDDTNGPYKLTALHIGIDKNHVKLVQMVCKIPGIDLEQRTLELLTPLGIAASRDIESCDALLRAGANCNAPSGVTRSTPLHTAAVLGRVDMLNRLLQEKTVIKNPKDIDQLPPLSFAVGAGHLPAVDVLLSAGTDPNEVYGPSERTILHYSVSQGRLPIVQRICCDLRTDIHKVDKEGYTPFDLAVFLRKKEIENFLASKGASHSFKVTLQAATQMDSNPLKTLVAARELLMKKKYTEAEKLLKTVHATHPHYSSFLICLGKVAIAQYKVEEARHYYEAAFKLNPEDGSAELGLGTCAYFLGKLQEAQRYHEIALQKCPKNNREQMRLIRLGLGEVLACQFKFAEADRYLQEELTQGPKNPYVYLCLGLASLLQGNLEQAEKFYRESIALDLDNSPAWASLGVIALKRKELDAANKFFIFAMKKDPNNPYAHSGFGDVDFEQDPDGAETHYKRSLELNRYNSYAFTGLGNVAFHRGKIDEAEGHYLKALQLLPPNGRNYVGLGGVEVKRGNLKKAEEYLTKAIEIEPTCSDAYFGLGSFVLKEDPEKAYQYLKKAAEFDPKNIEIFIKVGELGAILHKFQEAEKYFEAARKEALVQKSPLLPDIDAKLSLNLQQKR